MNNERLVNTEAECAVLGALLEQPALVPVVAPIVAPEDFFATQHKLVYRAILDVTDKVGSEWDALMVGEHLIATGDANQAGGVAYLYDLLEGCLDPDHAAAYAERVRDLADRRRAVTAGRVFLKQCSDLECGLEVAHEELRQVLQQRMEQRRVHTLSIREPARDVLEHLNDPASIRGKVRRLGIFTLESSLQLVGGETGVLGGYPGVGKSAFCRWLLLNALGIQWKGQGQEERLEMRETSPFSGQRVLLFSTEMGRELLTHAFVAQLSGVPMSYIRDPAIRLKHHRTRIVEALAVLESLGGRLWINDVPRLTPGAIVNEARLAAMKMGGLDLLIIDHLNQVAGRERNEDMRLFVDTVLRDYIFPITKEIGCATIVVSQLNRAGHRLRTPAMDMFKESGGIEESAFWAAILWPGPRVAFHEAAEQAVDCCIVKNKSGPIGRVPFVFQRSCMRFRELEEEEIVAYKDALKEQDSPVALAAPTLDFDPDEIPF